MEQIARQTHNALALLKEKANSRHASSGSSTPPTAPARTSQATIELTRRYGPHEKFLAIFSPDHQLAFSREPDRIFTGSAPSLALVSRAYGANIATSWVEIQLDNLATFSGCREKLTDRQLSETAAIILETYGYMKITELMYFFFKFKSGAYGKFYGSVDPLHIMSALHDDFCPERSHTLQRLESLSRKADPDNALFDSAAELHAYMSAHGLKPDQSLAENRNKL